MSLVQSIQLIQQNIAKTAHKSPLAAKKIMLLAASKGQSETVITQAIEAGISEFGENRVQEAEEKWPALRKNHPGVQLHLIGPLQTNKVKKALELFDVIQTIDRPKLALAIANALVKSDTRFFIQVNIGEEPQKAGVMPQGADALIGYCRELHLPLTGLMCIPPSQHPPAPYFALLREIAKRNGLQELSMGMSEDYETAIRMGSTCVRLGRIVFGDRKTA